MLDEIKNDSELTSLQKTARKVSGRVSCIDCPIYKRHNHRCNNEDLIIVCMYAFEKGFVHGVKHHRKIIKLKHGNTL